MKISSLRGALRENSRPRGRPRDAQKAASILRAARQLFLEHGIDATRIDDIATMAGVSKMTVYATFVDKAAVFEAMIAHENEQIERAFTELPQGARTLSQELVEVGRTLLELLLRDDIMRMDAILASESRRHPELGQRFYNAGPKRMWDHLAQVIARAAARGEIAVDEPVAAAEDLISLWLGMQRTTQHFGGASRPTPESIRQRVERGVGVFLRANAVRPS